MRFQIGDTVKIAKSSEWYDSGHKYNPKDTKGWISVIDEIETITVEWDNHTNAPYNENDLRLVRRES